MEKNAPGALVSHFSARPDPVVPGHAATEAGCVRLDLPHYSAGLPRPPQLHGAQQAKGARGERLGQSGRRVQRGQQIKTHLFCPQVRKAAQQGVCAILRGSDFLFRDHAPSHHPAAATTAKFCAAEIERAGGADDADATPMPSSLYL